MRVLVAVFSLACLSTVELTGQEGLADVNSRVELMHFDYLAGVHDWPDSYAFVARGSISLQGIIEGEFVEKPHSIQHLGLICESEKFEYHGSCWVDHSMVGVRVPWEQTIVCKEGGFATYGTPGYASTIATEFSRDQRVPRTHPCFQPYFMPFAFGGAFMSGKLNSQYGEKFIGKELLHTAKFDKKGNAHGVFSQKLGSRPGGLFGFGVADITFSGSPPHLPIRTLRRNGNATENFDIANKEELRLDVITESEWKRFTVNGKSFSAPTHIRQHFEGIDNPRRMHEFELFFKYDFSIDPKTDLIDRTSPDWRKSVIKHFDDDLNPVFNRDIHGKTD